MSAGIHSIGMGCMEVIQNPSILTSTQAGIMPAWFSSYPSDQHSVWQRRHLVFVEFLGNTWFPTFYCDDQNKAPKSLSYTSTILYFSSPYHILLPSCIFKVYFNLKEQKIKNINSIFYLIRITRVIKCKALKKKLV